MGIYARTDEIIEWVRDIKENWGNDPFAIAERIGVKVVVRESGKPGGNIVSVPSYFTIITILGKVSDTARRVLCAHELGHAMLHQCDSINYFNVSTKLQDMTEYEANLFAVALLFDENEFSRPLNEMPNSLLRVILDYNIK